MKNVTLKFIRTVLCCAIALLGILAVSGTAAHADLTGPKPPTPPIGSGAATGDASTLSQLSLFGAR